MTKFIRSTAMTVLLSFSSSFIVAPAHAAIVSTEQAITVQQLDRSELKQFFDREDIANALQAQGISSELAKARVDSMTEEEAQRLANHIENAPAGAGVVGVLFTVFIVLLVTDILGLTKVFPFTRSIR
jgi:hypothetical protein